MGKVRVMLTCKKLKDIAAFLEFMPFVEPEFEGQGIGEDFASFKLVIEKDGSISDIKMLNGLSIDIKMECERVLSLLPDFIPALRGGNPVQSELKIPLSFKLE